MDGDVIVDLNAEALASFFNENNYMAEIEEGAAGQNYIISERSGCLFSVFPFKMEIVKSVSHICFLAPFQIDISLYSDSMKTRKPD